MAALNDRFSNRLNGPHKRKSESNSNSESGSSFSMTTMFKRRMALVVFYENKSQISASKLAGLNNIEYINPSQ